MQIRVETARDDLDGDARQRIERRVRFVMRRMRAQVMQVHVRLRDINGPRGGVDQSCQITLATDQHGTLVVHAVERHAMEALAQALKRAAGALVRSWQRQRRPVRGWARRQALAAGGAV